MDVSFIFSLLLRVVFGTDTASLLSFVTAVLTAFGMWGIFRKAGFKGRWVLVPCVEEYKTGQLAGREAEGRVAAVTRGVTVLITITDGILELIAKNISDAPGDVMRISRLQTLTLVVTIVAGIIMFVYRVRIFLGLIEVYGRKNRWIILWILIPCIPACLWGWGKRFRPQWTVSEMRNETADFFSGAKARVLDRGLTVNLEERTAREFFRKKCLLRDIHMTVEPGHMVLLLGGSGAGKTTFLNAVNGYEKARAEVVLNGTNMYRHYKEMQYDIGFVPQLDLMRGSDSVYRTLMDAANLRLPLGFTRADRKARVDEVMDIFGLAPVKDDLVVKLSGGQRKRLSIAMEFISNPSLFILDEPDSGLDGVMARELFTRLRMIADQGKIIIVITHTPDRVIDLFDDVIVLAKDASRTGRLAFFGPIGEARKFFGRDGMEEIVKSVNRAEEGGEGRADELIRRFAEVQHG